MSKLKNPLLSLGAVGRLAKDIIFTRRRKVDIVEKKPIPKDVKSLLQLDWRHMYQKAVLLWHALSALEKQEWESLARPKHMTGFAYFISLALKPNPGLYLPLQGGTMAGDINMALHKILTLIDPTLSQDAATKAYVDLVVANMRWGYTLNDTPSGIGAYYKMSPFPTGEPKSTFTSGVLSAGDGQALFQWISDEVVTFDTIEAGVISVHTHAQRTAGNRSVQIYAEIYEYTVAPAEVLIATTELSEFVTDAEAAISFHATLAADYDIAPTSKLLIKFLANIGTTGSNVTVALYAEGATASRVSLPVPTSAFFDIFNTFIGETDTPASYAGDALKGVRVNAAENALEFAAIAAAGLSSKLITSTRVMTAASGSVAYTGVGFQPTCIICFAVKAVTESASWGFSDSAVGERVIFRSEGTTALNYSADHLIWITTGGATDQFAAVSSYNADGFTLSWTKRGSPTGTATLLFLCLK